jgi:hypothetical protein
MKKKVQKKRRERVENIVSSNMAPISSAEKLKKVFQFVKQIKQTLIEATRNVKIMKQAMNYCLDEMLLLITQQSNALSDIQGKCSY